ncbi:hypothetical protein GLOTRDRAFT_139413 [Gloeophyllum trabeum ATCC 11539]|uniref:TPR-like protein n=1 Tax=Gloeophyllum trabeum (strain ATCC 11539 / FP-39264 / Madison 617) TaxID=670483 RepID=S7Q334_GLOTA|nr:uncharacterized protein GLOTRDRAFT_139413 [Gloeophyllum trabeum ATCC 11539]EPQ53962.1 hypothetical protein GLOTRDRAFT_139413 [Gloeophyllum trabeum ATCC 11539]
MPAKYSHVKKRAATSPPKKSNGKGHHHHGKHHRSPDPHLDRTISKAMSAVSELEQAIAHMLLIRFEQDIARLFSTHLYCVALVHLPTFVMRCITVGGPGWVAANADSEEVKDFFRACIGMDLRQSGERVATKSVLWSYTALRHFALSNNVPICRKRGLHSLRLLPYYSALKAHVETLLTMPAPAFSKPPHLGPLTEGLAALEDACEHKWAGDGEWRAKVRTGYERACQTLWRVAREFDVRGYGRVLREKLTTKWCNCGCSTDHLGEVCERTVREDEEESGVRAGKEREWDGRGAGVYGWETEDEEDVWELDLDFSALDPDECDEGVDPDMTIGELMEWRYLRAEWEKEQGNAAFRRAEYECAIERYKAAHEIEPEMPRYQLNLAAAYLKVQKWMEAEDACTIALGQHKSSKGYFRRAKARAMQGRIEDAIKDLRATLKVQPGNPEAIAELIALLPPPDPAEATPADTGPAVSPSAMAAASSSSSSSSWNATSACNDAPSPYPEYLRIPKPKPPRPLPFARTEADDRKIKILWQPLTVDMPIDDPCTAQSSPDGKRTQKKAAWLKSKGTSMKTETFTYPNWERYIVMTV